MAESPLRLYLLGTFRLVRANQEIPLPRRKMQALLAYLVLHPEAHAREKIAALFWGDSGDQAARSSLRNEISALRRLVHDDLLLTDRETVQLNPAANLWTDIQALHQEIAASKQVPVAPPSSLLPYPGELLPDFYDDWIVPLREQFRTQYIDALLAHVQQARSQSCDPSGHGEGKTYLGVKTVITDSNGNAPFTFTTSKILLHGTQVTTTATDSAGDGTPLNTSEFSKCKAMP